MDSILNSVKQHLGGEMVAEVFDPDIIMAINTIIGTLKQAGVKVIKDAIDDKATMWTEVFPDISTLEMIKSYVCIKAKQYFDPSASSTLNELYESQLEELLWRINVESDPHWKEMNEDG